MRNRLSVLVLAVAVCMASSLPATVFAAPAHDMSVASTVSGAEERALAANDDDPAAGTGRDIIVSRDDKDKD